MDLRFSRRLGAVLAAGAAVLAGPALAQATDCGGIGAGAGWIGGSAEASDVSTAGAALSAPGLLVPPSGNVVVLFTVSAAGEVRLEAQPAPGGDPVIELYDASGGLVVTDDDSGGNFASRIETLLQPGDYCLATRGFGGAPLTAEVRVGRLEHEAATQGLAGGFLPPGGGLFDGPLFVGIDPCLPETAAQPLADGPMDALLGQGGASAVNTISQVPYYRFELAQPQAISIRVPG